MDGNGGSLRRRPQRELQCDLGLGIVRLRRRKGWSQAVLARRLEITRHRLGKWELGLRPPSLKDLVALLTVLEVTFEDLMGAAPAPAVPAVPAAMRNEALMCLNGFLRAIKPVLGTPSGKEKKKE